MKHTFYFITIENNEFSQILFLFVFPRQHHDVIWPNMCLSARIQNIVDPYTVRPKSMNSLISLEITFTLGNVNAKRSELRLGF